MSDTLASQPASEAAPRVDAAGTPQEYRAAHPGIHGFRLVSATVTVELLEDARRARYVYECELETEGETPAKYWYYDLPAESGETRGVRAWDAGGSLQTRTLPGGREATRMEVRLRGPVRQGERRTFAFGYESVIRSLVMEGGRSRTVAYNDWVIFNIPCDLLRVQVVLPSRSALIRTYPDTPQDETGRAVYVVRDLRPLETVTYLVAYRRTQIGIPFYKWLASAIGSGLIGGLIALALEK